MYSVYLLSGSNEGDRTAQLNRVLLELEEKAGTIVRTSRVYETEAWGLEGLPAHLNQAILLETVLEPLALLDVIQQIEHRLGRIRQEKWGVRTIDIDIIYFGNQAFEQPRLTVPHPLLQLRRFVLAPLAEIAPRYLHPVLHKTNQQLEQECKDPLSVTPVKKSSPSLQR